MIYGEAEPLQAEHEMGDLILGDRTETHQHGLGRIGTLALFAASLAGGGGLGALGLSMMNQPRVIEQVKEPGEKVIERQSQRVEVLEPVVREPEWMD